ncbi:hypothetical protein JYQ62_02105 [Nostoc sp. UHCC 0702]|nr:hypothetical protein JYQ62_02105 [Nostoc sp. UHCC 0702]
MANANLIQTIYPATQTQAGTASAIVTAMQNAGFGSPIDTFVVNSENHNVFQLVFDNSKSKGTAYIDVWVAGGPRIRWVMYDSWNTTTKTGSNGSAFQEVFPLFYSNQIVFTACNHPEIKMVNIFQQGSVNTNIAVIRPTNKPSWWDENQWLYAFVSTNSVSFNSWMPSNLNPMGVTSNITNICTFMTSPAFVNANTNNLNKRDTVNGLILCFPTAAGMLAGSVGRTSDDLALGCCGALNMFDVFQVTPGQEEYTMLSSGGTPGFMVRTL